MKTIDAFWHLPLNISATLFFKRLQEIHTGDKSVSQHLKQTPEEKEIRRVLALGNTYDIKSGHTFLKDPKRIEYICNNLNFLLDRYNGSNKQYYLKRLKRIQEEIHTQQEKFASAILYHFS